ncbi:GTP 3',8-cyclase MoaA [Pseudoflavonifractor phocaeensis]|nr:GTP 3',8-cyclase MoaA [Pseudoflavonifractor phocaeensis]MBM6723276.1 GTP 3',8-cyclase MoaA [Pseudoflavonifractor phocaeensis]
MGRDIRYLRISVTDRCNLRCRYCMPEEGVEWMDHGSILTYEQIVRLVGLFAALGVEKVRLTGGEPLVRKGLERLVRAIKEVPGIRRVRITTNGLLLAEQLPGLLAAGLDGVNLSLDTLDRVQYQALTRRDGLEQALEGLEAALAQPGLRVKLNCVPMGENDSQLVPLAALARGRKVDVRFIELMPIGLGDTLPRRTQGEVLAVLEQAFGPAGPCGQSGGSGPGRYVTFPGFTGRVGFISAVSHQFCEDCNRVRLTAAGFFKTCLQYDCGINLKALLDSGADKHTLRAAMERAIFAKPACHHFSASGTAEDERRSMYQIGG